MKKVKWHTNNSLARLTLFLPIFFVIMVAILFVTIVSINNSRQNIIKSTEETLTKEVDLLLKMLQREKALKTEKVLTGLNITHTIFYSRPLKIDSKKDYIEIENQITKNRFVIPLKRWLWNNQRLYNDFTFVDSIKQILRGGTVTVFQKCDSGYVRISTNVKKADNSRAIGTFIPNDSPVVKTIEKGKRYIGRAYVVNQWYITAYEPLYHENHIVGMLYFGDKEKNLDKLGNIINSIKPGKSGFVIVVDRDKKCIIAQNDDADKYKSYLPDRLSGESGIIRYKYENEKLLAVYKYFNDFKLYVVAIVNETKETKEEIGTIIKASLLTALLITIILSVFIYLITSKNISRFLIKIKQKEETIQETTKELIQSENRFKTLFENTGDDIIVSNKDGKIIEVNKTICNTLGYSREEMLKMTIADIRSPKYAAITDQTCRLILQKGKLTFEAEHETKQGEIIQVEIKSRVIDSGNDRYILSIARNISERKKMIRRVLKAVIQTEERERERFAREMHDGLGPLLSAVKLYANELNDPSLSHEERKEMTRQVDELIDEAIANTRSISNDLMPRVIIDYGVVKAVRSYCEKINKTEKVNIRFSAENIDDNLDQNVQLILYRVISELINNTLKHASAKNIDINLCKTDNKIELNFRDDGKGFDVDAIMKDKNSGMGLKNITSRIRSINGNCSFISHPGEGFKIDIEIEL